MYDVRYVRMTGTVGVGRGEEGNDGRTEKATSWVASYELFLLNDDTSLMKWRKLLLLTCYFLQSNCHRKLQTIHYSSLAVVEATLKVTVVTPYASGNKFKVSEAVFLSFTTSLMYNRCPVLLMNHDGGKLKKNSCYYAALRKRNRAWFGTRLVRGFKGK
jgi:hypothetical protein